MASPIPPAPAACGRLHGSVLEIIGATPLVRLPRRVEATEREGLIRPGHSTLVEPSSGNSGPVAGIATSFAERSLSTELFAGL